jgi:hypothetical protein
MNVRSHNGVLENKHISNKMTCNQAAKGVMEKRDENDSLKRTIKHQDEKKRERDEHTNSSSRSCSWVQILNPNTPRMFEGLETLLK